MIAPIKRREFISLLGGAAAWPLAARAQQVESTPRIGLLWPGDAPPASPRMESFRHGLRALGFVDGQNVAIELRYAQRGPQQLPELAAELVRLKVDVISAHGDFAPKVAQQANVFSSPILASLHREIIAFAAEYRLPAIYQWKEHVEAGGLVSYGPGLAAMWRQSAIIVGKVLKGVKPADLPVEQPTKFDLIINLKTAKQVGLTIPPNVLAHADKVIK